MKMRRFRILLSTALIAPFSGTISHAATRARFVAETILNDPSVRLSAGGGATCQVNDDGTVRCWGLNRFGELGNGSTNSSAVPVLVSGITTAVAIATGGGQSCALLR